MATNCPRCGIDVQPSSLTCRQCGEPLPGDASRSSGSSPAGDAAGSPTETTEMIEPTDGGGWGGSTPPPPPGGEPSAPVARGGQDAQNLAMLSHLSALVMFVGIPSFLGPLVVWLWQRDKDPFVTDQAAEALNFNLSVLIYSIVGGIIAAIFAVVTLGLGVLVVVPVFLVLAVAWLVLVVVAGLRAAKGERYRYPVTIRFVR